MVGGESTLVVGVDHGNSNSDLREAQPGNDVFRTVVHEKCHRILRLEALGLTPSSNLVGKLVHFAVGNGGAI